MNWLLVLAFACTSARVSLSFIPQIFSAHPRHLQKSAPLATDLQYRTPTSSYLDSIGGNEVERDKLNDGNAVLKSNNIPRKTVIVGGGPSGLATAIMLAERGYSNIHIYEKLERPPTPESSDWGDPDRSYMLGLGGRGQTSLKKLGAFERVAAYCGKVEGRIDLSSKYPEPVEEKFNKRKYKTMTLSRDRLVSCLLSHVESKYPDSIKVNFNVDCTKVDWSGIVAGKEQLSLTLAPTNETAGHTFVEEAEFVVGADGVRSILRNAMELNPNLVKSFSGKAMKSVRFENKNERIYKTIQLRIPKDKPVQRNYCASSPGGVNFEALPNFEGHLIGLVLYKPGHPELESIETMQDAKDFFLNTFPRLSQYFNDEDYKKFAVKSPSRLPLFTYCGPVLHVGKHCVLLGDTIKTVKPYFGIGVNSAFEDVCILNDCLEKTNDDRSLALPMFSRQRAPSTKALVELSHGFDSTGIKQYIFFILPLILDGIFSSLLPRFFKPNTIQLLQVPESGSFSQVRRRKWIDRIMQATVLAAVARSFYSVGVIILRRMILLVIGR